MRNFLTYKYNNLYPLLAILTGLTIVIFGLVYAQHYECTYFLIAVYLLSFLFINYKTCLKGLIFLAIFGSFFFLFTYLSSKSIGQSVFMVNRIASFTVGMLPGMSVGAERLTRNLSQIRMPRGMVIGLLIVFSFMPTLTEEIKRVKEAMKTRGSYNILNPKVLYRAFLIPFITRIVDISDTLSLSIETRGFDLKSKNYTVYRKEYLTIYDILFLLLIIAIILLVIIL